MYNYRIGLACLSLHRALCMWYVCMHCVSFQLPLYSMQSCQIRPSEGHVSQHRFLHRGFLDSDDFPIILVEGKYGAVLRAFCWVSRVLHGDAGFVLGCGDGCVSPCFLVVVVVCVCVCVFRRNVLDGLDR